MVNSRLQILKEKEEILKMQLARAEEEVKKNKDALKKLTLEVAMVGRSFNSR